MSKQTKEFFEQLRFGQEPGIAATLKEVGGKLWDALTPMAEHGAHEMASALFRGDAYVMYPHQGKGAQGHEGQGLEQLLEQTKEGPQQQQHDSKIGVAVLHRDDDVA